MTPLTIEQRQAVDQAGNDPVRLEDPVTRRVFVLIAEEEYRRLRKQPDEVVDLDAQKAMLVQLGRTVGWDDPAMDVYNDL
ncbi:MAG TPA: hypothetical protein VGH33_23420 [Isosphaeraceae bacterium]